MDTSSDFSSPTYDFLIGRGLNLPVPTAEEMARLLIRIGESLRHNNTLHDIVGNRPIVSSSGENYALERAMERFMPERLAELQRARTREVYGHERYGDDTGFGFYLGYDGHEVLWFWVKDYYWRSPNQGPIECIELDAESMTEVLSRFEWAMGPGWFVLEGLVKLAKKEVEAKRERLQKLESQATLLEHTLKLVRATHETLPAPVGLEF
jgi:hypothetical protein